MINSRSLDDLKPVVADKAKKLIALLASQGIDIIVTSTYRDFESQDVLYAQGRTTPGKIVTNAKSGMSFHNYRVAFDVVPVVGGKPVWGTTGEDLKIWQKIGLAGKSLGLEWAGDWKTFKEFPHFQYTEGKSLNDLRKEVVG